MRLRLHLNLALGEIASLLGSDKFLEFKGGSRSGHFCAGSWVLGQLAVARQIQGGGVVAAV